MEDKATVVTEESNPNEVMYAIFCGDINSHASSKFSSSFSQASVLGAKHLHILFHSWGGFVGDGIFLHNLFKNFNIEITLYNIGQISSAASVAYLGARNRITAKNAAFMIHKSHTSPVAATADKLSASVDHLMLEDHRTEELMKEALTLPDEIWEKHKYHDVHILGEDAVKYGIATDIGIFSPPPGVKIYNILA